MMKECEEYRKSQLDLVRDSLAGGDAACAECSGVFKREDMIAVGGRLVCARCKPVSIQKLSEGASWVKKPLPIRPNTRRHILFLVVAILIAFLTGLVFQVLLTKAGR
jgi:hypothetical protein